MRTVTYSLQQFLTEARRGAFVIPRFQRPFVWNQPQVKLLIDSTARNYPIGSLLLLQETDPQRPFLASRSIDAVIHDHDSESFDSENDPYPSTGLYYVLDGQQRLTSLLRVFQSSPDVNYFFDLHQLMEFESPSRVSPSWVVKRGKGRQLPTRYLRGDAVLDAERCQILVDEYFESGEETVRGDRAAQRKIAARVNRVFETLRNYQLPLVIIDRGESTEAICRIFETINSTGTKLTTFDLAVARFFPTPDLHELWKQSRETHSILSRFDAEGERVLQVIALLVADEKKTYVEATRGTLLTLPKEEIENRWNSAVEALAEAYTWVEARGAVPNLLANEALLVPLAFFFAKVSDHWKRSSPGFSTILERWYFANTLQQGARQASNYRVSQATTVLRDWIQDGIVPKVPQVTLSSTDLLALSKSDNRYRAIHALLRWKANRDLWSGAVMQADEVEDHHLFPAALAKRDGVIKKRALDSIANKLLVSTATNRMLGDRMPRDYMSKLLRDAQRNGTLRNTREMLAAACIPTDESIEDTEAIFDQTHVGTFLERRADLLMGMLDGVLGDALSTTSLIEEEDDDEVLD